MKPRQSKVASVRAVSLPAELGFPQLETAGQKPGSAFWTSLIGAIGTTALVLGILASIFISRQLTELGDFSDSLLITRSASEAFELKSEVDESVENPSQPVARLATLPPSPRPVERFSIPSESKSPDAIEVPEVDSDSMAFSEVEKLEIENHFIATKHEKPAPTTDRSAEIAAQKLQEKKRKEAERMAALARKTVRSASVASRVSPSYPGSARRKHIQGRVVVAVSVGSNGLVSGCKLSESSGSVALDRAALDAAEKFRFNPAINGLGKPKSSSCKIPFTFKLR